MQFIGHLYRQKMLTERIMHECIKKLLADVSDPMCIIHDLLIAASASAVPGLLWLHGALMLLQLQSWCCWGAPSLVALLDPLPLADVPASASCRRPQCCCCCADSAACRPAITSVWCCYAACGLCSAAGLESVYVTADHQDPCVLLVTGLSLSMPVHTMLPPAGGRAAP